MNKLTVFYFVFIALISFIPAHALQISGTEEGVYEGEQVSFTEIYQDGHLVRLEDGQLSYRYHDGECLLADNEHGVYIENTCKEIATEIAKQITQQIASMQEEHKEGLAAAQKMAEMLQGKQSDFTLKKTSTGDVSGFNTTIYSAGPSKYWVSAELLSKIKKEIDYDELLKTQQQLLNAYSQANSLFNTMEQKQNIEAQLMAKGYLMKQIDSEAMNPMMLNMLSPETREAILADMGEGSVVLEVASIENAKVNIAKYKPSGRKVSIAEYLHKTMLEE